MNENFIILNCKVPSEAYQVLTMLRKNPNSKGFKISHGALVKKEAGKLSMEDSFAAEAEKEGLFDELVGGLVDLLAGPVGLLFAGGAGALMDKKEEEDTKKLLEKASEHLADGDTAVLLLAQEKDEAALAEKLKDLEIAVIRMDLKELAAEIESAE